ncbi:MAG: c-type cytochrome biogenesis protein CcmI, partial [Betaproteobacteria bacterium]|nr:c-type cytochrome biogenesis protein CcmI [Betaproteobacteria bacterium]
MPSSSPPPARRHALLWAALAVGAAVALVAVSYSLWVGNSKSPDPPARVEPALAHAVTPAQMGTLAERLEERLRQKPDDAAGWTMLARSYATLGRFEPAARAYAQAAKRTPNNADLLADYADALAMARGRKMEGEPLAIVRRALAIDPGHVKSLALAGSAEFERQRYSAAVAYWERLVPLTDAHSEIGRSIRRSIGQARELGKLPPGGAASVPALPHPPIAAAAAPAAAAGVAGTVKLAPALVSRVAPGDALYIFAHAAQGE